MKKNEYGVDVSYFEKELLYLLQSLNRPPDELRRYFLRLADIANGEVLNLNAGNFIIRKSSPLNSKDLSFATSVSYKIGKIGFVTVDKKQKVCKISICDGLVLIYEDKEELLRKINEDKHGYRQLHGEELITLLNYTAKIRVKENV